MGSSMKSVKFIMALGIVGGMALALAPAPVLAQDASSMSCGELWYARNAIYARNGYCFKTERGIASFGPGCFPPYGQLSGWDRSRVNELQMWERRNGC